MTRLRRLTLAALLLPLFTGCSILGIGLTERRPAGARGDAPIQVTSLGRSELTGKKIDEVLKTTDKTLVQVPLQSDSVRKAAEKLMPAVVNIYIETRPYEVNLLPIPVPGTHFTAPLPGKALGSGFFVHPRGYILTNNHVVEEAHSIKAKTSDDKTYDVVLLARDPVLDAALLRVNVQNVEFPYIPMGKSADIGVGDYVVAIGNPLGLGHTVTQGIISQTHREIPGMKERLGREIGFIQTDTAINPGSSGGPLLTLAGAAIGINTAVAWGAQGIAFTIPSDEVREFVEKVLAGSGEIERGR